MSTEPEPTQPQPTTPPEPADPVTTSEPDAPIEVPPPVDEPEPEEDTTPPPPPGQHGDLSVTVDPGTWYRVTSVCVTTTCHNLNVTTTEPEVYSNAGKIRMVCGPCGKDRAILEAVKLDPQPEMS